MECEMINHWHQYGQIYTFYPIPTRNYSFLWCLMAIKLICLHFDEGMQVSMMWYEIHQSCAKKKKFLFLFCFSFLSLFMVWVWFDRGVWNFFFMSNRTSFNPWKREIERQRQRKRENRIRSTLFYIVTWFILSKGGPLQCKFRLNKSTQNPNRLTLY